MGLCMSLPRLLVVRTKQVLQTAPALWGQDVNVNTGVGLGREGLGRVGPLCAECMEPPGDQGDQDPG